MIINCIKIKHLTLNIIAISEYSFNKSKLLEKINK